MDRLTFFDKPVTGEQLSRACAGGKFHHRIGRRFRRVTGRDREPQAGRDQSVAEAFQCPVHVPVLPVIRSDAFFMLYDAVCNAGAPETSEEDVIDAAV